MYKRYQGQERWNATRRKWNAVRHFNLLSMSINIPPGRSLLQEDVRSWSHSFANVMSSEIGRQLFTKFLETEYSDENMMFWNACEDLKKEHSNAKRRNMARDVYDMFVAPTAPLEINLDARIRSDLSKRVNRPDRMIFSTAQEAVYTLMERDCYRRFVKSKIYADFVATLEATTATRSASQTHGNH